MYDGKGGAGDGVKRWWLSSEEEKKPVPNNTIMATDDSRARNGRHPIAYYNIPINTRSIPRYSQLQHHSSGVSV